MPISAPTDVRLIADTVATRRPATITGIASGSSTARNRLVGRKPTAVAAAVTSPGTASSASVTERTSSAIV